MKDNLQKVRKLEKKALVLLKPNYIQCSYERETSDKRCIVKLFGKQQEVKL